MAVPPPSRAPPPPPQTNSLPLATAALVANTTAAASGTAATSAPSRMLTRSNTIRLVTDDEAEAEEAQTLAATEEESQIQHVDRETKLQNTQRPTDSRRGHSSPPALPPAMLAYLQDTSDHPAHASFAASAALLDDSDPKDSSNLSTKYTNNTNNTNSDRPSLTHRSSSTVTITTPAGPIAVASPDRIRTTSPLSHLRQTLVESYSTGDMGDIKTAAAAAAATAAARQSPIKATRKPESHKTKTKASPTKSASYSTMPPSTRRLVQQSTEDFVMRTSRSVARDQSHEPRPSQQQQQLIHTHKRTQSQEHASQPKHSYTPHAPQKQNMPAYYTGSNGVQHHWQRPAPIKSRTGSVPQSDNIVLRKKAAPGVLFAALPGEVLELILDELKKLHYDDFAPTHNKSDVYIGEHSSCATCWMRDACSMALTARKMLKYARVSLYEAIEIVGADTVQEAHHHHHFYSHKKPAVPVAAAGSARVTLLLRTLRGSPQIAAVVRSLKVPSLALYQSVPGVPAAGASGTIPDDYETLVASLVMSCPNLERVLGFHPTYDHTLHSRYFHALSTRPRLKEMTWILEPIFSQAQYNEIRQQGRQREEQQALLKKYQKSHKSRRSRTRSISAIIRPHSLPSPPASPPLGGADVDVCPAPPTSSIELNPRQSARFLNHHVNWQYLSTLTVHCKAGATLAPNAALLTECLSLLPRLQKLYLSHLPARAFDDNALLSLPASLRKLALDHVQGVTSDGLSTFATRPSSKHLMSLSLVHADNLAGAGGLPALARTLSKLAELKSFTLVQSQPPTLASGETVWLFPYLASPSLTHLHWDIPSALSSSNSADAILARSIAAAGFPSLTTLRAPADPEGLFQSLCRPQERVDLAADRSRSLVTDSSHYYAGYTAPAAFTSATSGSSSPPPAHAHRHSESSSTSSASVFSASLAHSRTNSSSISSSLWNGNGNIQAQAKTLGSPPVSAETAKPAPLHTNLHHARIAAQSRIDSARRTPRFFVNVTDEGGTLLDKFGMGGFVGTVGSPIVYHLKADADASDDKGGLVDITDFLADGGEVLGGKDKEGDTFKAARVCSGQWNADWDAPQKKDRERWHHTERGRWRGVTLI